MKQFSEYPASRRALLILSSGLLTGYVPFASGTFASLLAIALFAPFRLLNVSTYPFAFVMVAILLALTAVAIWSADVAERTYGEKDSHKIVIDEIVGFFVAMAFVPFRWPHVAAAFVVFRVLDVVKPAPIRHAQRLPGGLGVVADDLLAGLYTCVIVHGLMSLNLLQ
ncbi:phosphatidylglycerophosphatase A [Candidatus Sumerlaeota bacterium]|nr:phosphatidylglycerophosphatase A [Candidatus Sumerlaeota bacterium]